MKQTGRACAITLVLALAALCAAASTARADSTFDFESPSLPAGTSVSGQYAGIAFDTGSAGFTAFLPQVVVSASGAHSGTHALQVAPDASESGVPDADWTFSATAASVSVWVRNTTSPNTFVSHLQLRAFDASGTRVDANAAVYTPVSAADPGWTELSASTTGSPIVRVQLVADPGDPTEQGQRIWFDDVTETSPAGGTGSTPDFTLISAAAGAVNQGATTETTISVARIEGSSGPLTFAATALPAGVTASFPNGATSADASVPVRLAAGLEARPGAVSVTVTATPADAAAGTQPRSTTFSVTVVETTPRATITNPAGGSEIDRPPDRLSVTGTASGPRPFAGACAVITAARLPVPAIPATCNGPVDPATGTWATSATGATTGVNWITAFVRDATGHVGVAQEFFRVATAATGLDVATNGMEVTQGIQPLGLATQSHGTVRSVPYSGVELVSDRTTWVRVYANAVNTSAPGAPVLGVTALLHVLRGGVEVHGSPLSPDGGPRNLAAGTPLIGAAERDDLASSYNFTVPASMVSGDVTFRAQINPPPDAVPECAECATNDTFTVTGVRFRPIATQIIMPVALIYTEDGVTHVPATFDPSRSPSAQVPSADFQLASRVFPLFLAVDPYQAVIDASRLINDPAHAAETADDDNWKNQGGNDLVSNWQRDNGIDGMFYVDGISPAAAGNRLRGLTTPYVSGFTDSIAIENRPLTAIAHEMGHYEGLPHASADPVCYSDGHGGLTQPGVDWPPDQHGYIQGIGLDGGSGPLTASNDSLIIPGQSPRVGPPAYAGQFFDFMSYCENPAGDDDSWVSTINWNRLVDAHNRGPLPSSRHASSAASATPVARMATAGPSTLTIDAVIGAGSQTRIVSVSPGTAPATRPAAGSPYHFVVRDGAGDVVSDTAVPSYAAHVDPGAAGEPASAFLSVSGTVPAAGVLAAGARPGASISLQQGSTILAKQTAPAHAPAVHIVSPRRDQRVRGQGVVRVGWTVTDPDPVTLSTSIDYSPGPSRPWHTIEVGTDRHVFGLPARFFTRATQARVRVRVNDGFHETAAVSAPFRAAGNPPAVTITGPRSGLRVRADATVSLTGQAFDETSHLLTGRRLTWLVGARTVGDGVAVATAGLAPGRRRITLRARDSRGRIGSASIVIHVVSVAPQFLTLTAPRKLGRHARRVVLRLASSVPAAVSIAGGGHASKAKAGRAVTRVAVTVRPGASPVHLRVTLRAAAGRHVTAPVTVLRG